MRGLTSEGRRRLAGRQPARRWYARRPIEPRNVVATRYGQGFTFLARASLKTKNIATLHAITRSIVTWIVAPLASARANMPT
jgi:hypothetical protein